MQKRREKFKKSVKSSEENEDGEAKMRKTTEKRDREERNWQREEIVMFSESGSYGAYVDCDVRCGIWGLPRAR